MVFRGQRRLGSRAALYSPLALTTIQHRKDLREVPSAAPKYGSICRPYSDLSKRGLSG